MKKKQLEAEYFEMRTSMRHNWNRILPFSDLFVDRWEKARFAGFGDKTSIYDSSIVMGDVKVGREVWIGPYTLLDGTGGELKIGDYCSISTGVQIYTHDTVKYCVSGGLQEKECAAVIIGSQCYIAPMSIVSKGVSIGKCSIVCAHSFVNQSFEENSIIAGIPARKIGQVIIDGGGMAELKYYHKGGGQIARVKLLLLFSVREAMAS